MPFSHRVVMGWSFGLCVGCARTADLSVGRIVDLTYAFDEHTVYWPTAEPFRLEVLSRGYTQKGYYYEANKFCAAEHGGTHIDAPVHFYEGRWTVDQIPLERLIGPGVVVDVSDACAENSDYQINTDDLVRWEYRQGQKLDGAIVLLRTGYGRYWPDRERYMGTAERGPAAVAKLHFPGLHPDAARWLVEKRSIKAIGLDTPSIDYGQSTHFASHVTLFAQNVPVFENVANLDKLPAKGFTIIALPMKISNGSGGPTRIIAILQR